LRTFLHQLKNIFASIHSGLDLASAKCRCAEARPFLDQAQESARRGAQLINDLHLEGEAASMEGSAADLPASQDSSAFEAPRASSPVSLEGSERILLVDDDEPVRLLIRAVLTYRGYEIIEACDGEEAVKRYQDEGPFDLVILDLHMPRLDGRNALDRIRALNPKARALALSGSVFERDLHSTDESTCAFDARLDKPFDNTELVALVRRLLDREREA
jgi:CheY-like chemotaxis protein